jgi:transcriptional regulator with XRE-family HTH domain
MGSKRTDTVDLVVGQNIRMYRMRGKLSQRELGQQVGVAVAQIQKYEVGKNRVSAGRLNEIARVLGVSLPTLFEGSPVGSLSEGELIRTLLVKRH